MKSHNEFLKNVAVESSLPAKTCRALGPESQEDISMYDSQQEKAETPIDHQSAVHVSSSEEFVDRSEKGSAPVDTLTNDALEKGDEGDKK